MHHTGRPWVKSSHAVLVGGERMDISRDPGLLHAMNSAHGLDQTFFMPITESQKAQFDYVLKKTNLVPIGYDELSIG